MPLAKSTGMRWFVAGLTALAGACSGNASVEGDAAGLDPVSDAAPAPPDGSAAVPADAAPPAECPPEAVAGSQTLACADGVSFHVQASEECVAGGCGLILDVHGATMTGDEEDLHTRLRELAVPMGYVVVQPTAPIDPMFLDEESWGTPDAHPYDDTVWRFLTAAREVFATDPKRVHMTGFSQGSYMTFRFLCAHSDVFASVAPFAGAGCFVTESVFTEALPTGVTPEFERPILYSHGTYDNLLPFGEAAAPFRDAIVAAWSLGAAESLHAETGYDAHRYVSPSGTVVEFWEHRFRQADDFIQGHCIPGPVHEGDGTYLGTGVRFRCLDDGQYDFGAEALRFFMEHPLP